MPSEYIDSSPYDAVLEILSFREEILWQIDLESDSSFYQLNSRPGTILLHPALYIKLLPDFGTTDDLAISDFAVFQDVTYIGTNFLVFGSTSDENNKPDVDESQFHERLFTQLRLVTGNTKIPRIWRDLRYGVMSSIPVMPKLGYKLPDPKYIGSGDLVTAIRWQNVSEIDQNIITNEIPVYRLLLFEAVSAKHELDFRKSVLFAAMSLESALSAAISSAYEQAKIGKHLQGSRIRISDPDKTDRRTEARDVVFDRLIQTARFQDQLHEIALYALGKSMLFDNKVLYDACVRLYRTRNKIAHTGDVNDSNLLTLDYKGADAAVEMTIRAFAWLRLPFGTLIYQNHLIAVDQFAVL